MEIETLKEKLDPSRVVRAYKVKVFDRDEEGNKLEEHHYMAKGSDSNYYIQTHPFLSCDCPDFTIREEVCKHLIRALVVEGDRHVLSVIKDLGMVPYFDLGIDQNG
jgi:hypothetical protein